MTFVLMTAVDDLASVPRLMMRAFASLLPATRWAAMGVTIERARTQASFSMTREATENGKHRGKQFRTTENSP